MMRRMVLVDLGNQINHLGSTLIETADKYKRVPNTGTIISIGPKCRQIKREDLGRECLVPVICYDDRLSPLASELVGLKKHWHAMVLEDDVELMIYT